MNIQGGTSFACHFCLHQSAYDGLMYIYIKQNLTESNSSFKIPDCAILIILGLALLMIKNSEMFEGSGIFRLLF